MVNEGGTQYVSGGGTATDTIIASGGVQDATAGGIISGGSNKVLGTALGGTIISGAAQLNDPPFSEGRIGSRFYGASALPIQIFFIFGAIISLYDSSYQQFFLANLVLRKGT